PAITPQLQELHQMVLALQNKCQSLDDRNKELDEKNTELTSKIDEISRTKRRKKKWTASNEIKRAVRKQYKKLCDYDEDFDEWNLNSDERSPFSAENLAISNEVVNVVRGLNPLANVEEIKSAIHISFEGKVDTEKKKKRIGAENYNRVMSHRGRKDYKTNKRKVAVEKAALDRHSKETWKKLISAELVSSEDELIEGRTKSFTVRPKLNRPAKITKFFEKLDEVDHSNMAKGSQFRACPRNVGEPSENRIVFTKAQKDAMTSLDITFECN
uniref:Uncharacterized protein n=1 Tax=Clytia hemisphaerica TaxID=252671 RepID=A0A7M5TVN0_9CNID